ncbi:MAG: hypothetical protein AAFV53_36295 [Myxococcota bacterium]
MAPEIPPPDLQLVPLSAAVFPNTVPCRLSIGEVTIEVIEDFNPQVLKRLMATVRAC